MDYSFTNRFSVNDMLVSLHPKDQRDIVEVIAIKDCMYYCLYLTGEMQGATGLWFESELKPVSKL